LTEQELIGGCKKNNSAYQKLLFDKYSGIMMTVCLRYACDQSEAEDMLQEGFVRVFRYIHQYRFEGPLEGWLKRIIVNAALRILQRKGILFSEIDEHVEGKHLEDADPFSTLQEREILQLISNLPTGYRVVFNMYVIEGYSHNEIAAILGVNSGTSRSQLAKAKKLLRQRILQQQKLSTDE
jgi:RNA polymerase sigma factor (sigma-70 family)